VNVAYVCPEYPVHDSANGISTYTSKMVEALLRRGHCVTVFCLRSRPCDAATGKGNANSVRVCWVRRGGMRLPLLRTAYFQLAYRLAPGYLPYRDMAVGLRQAVREAHREEPIDILQCPEWAGLPWWLLPIGLPLVVRLHCPISVSWPADGVRWSRKLRAVARLERRCLETVPVVSAPSQSMVTRTEEVLNLRLPEVRIIPNAVDVVPSGSIPNPTGDSRSILFVGRTDLLKGFDCLIQGFQHLAVQPEFDDVRLEIVGPDSGLLLGGRNRTSGSEYVLQSVGDAGIRSRIGFTGRLSYDEVHKLRWRGRVVVVPSRFENFPNTVVEAMAAGCAVVASDAGGIPEIIQHQRNGLLFRSTDWRGLAGQIERLLRDDTLRATIAAQAQVDVRERYSPQLVTAQTERLYAEAIDRQQHPL